MRVRYWRIVLLQVLIIALGAAAAPTRAQEPPLITIAATANDSTTSALYAVKAGLFKKAGLNVKLVPMSSGSAVVTAVAGGAVQIGNVGIVIVIAAHTKHIPFTVIGPSAMFDDSASRLGGLTVRKDSSIRTARDFNGKTIAVPGLNDLAALGFQAWADKNGGDSSTVRYIEMPSSVALPAVASGRVDATYLTTPLLTQGLENGSVRVVTDMLSAISKRFIVLAWITTDDYAAKNRDVIERFARVMHESALYCNAHQTETVDMIAEFAKLDPAVVRNMTRATFAPYITPALIQPLIDAAAKYKAIDAPFDAQELISPYVLRAPSR